ncbi:MAG: IS200/IS605 family transposase [Motiliproteus sp.]
MQLTDDAELSATVRMVKSISSRNIHSLRTHKSPIWQRGFHDRALRRTDDIKATARYVVANPVRAGLVRSVKEYSLWDAQWL